MQLRAAYCLAACQRRILAVRRHKARPRVPVPWGGRTQPSDTSEEGRRGKCSGYARLATVGQRRRRAKADRRGCSFRLRAAPEDTAISKHTTRTRAGCCSYRLCNARLPASTCVKDASPRLALYHGKRPSRNPRLASETTAEPPQQPPVSHRRHLVREFLASDRPRSKGTGHRAPGRMRRPKPVACKRPTSRRRVIR